MSTQPVHASCVALDGRAVLLIGASGSGKSDLALRLVDRGWTLVADDYVHLRPAHGRLLASPPDRIAGQMEVRNVGLVSLPFASDIPVCLAVLLDREPERLPEPGEWRFAGQAVPALPLPAFQPSTALKVEHMLRLHGLSLE